jgi:hypothetical protein
MFERSTFTRRASCARKKIFCAERLGEPLFSIAECLICHITIHLFHSCQLTFIFRVKRAPNKKYINNLLSSIGVGGEQYDNT